MLLSVAAAIVALGLAVWVLGQTFSYTGIAIIGAAFILVAGSGVALTDLEQPTGQVVVKEYNEHNVSSNETMFVNNRSVYQTATTDVSLTDQFGALFGQLGLGGLLLLLGATMMAQTLQERAA